MYQRVSIVLAIFALLCVGAFAQNPITADSPFQVHYFSNMNLGDSVINISNTGASSTGPGFPTQNGNLAVNVYTYDPSEELVSCCCCVVTPNGLISLSVANDLLSNTLTPGVVTSGVVKLVSSSGGTGCNAATAGTAGNTLVPGLVAWETNLHSGPSGTSMTETAFTPATLSGAELNRATLLCSFIQTNGTGFGICKSCRFGGLGGVKK